jgi:hypothetical protein
MLFFFVTPLFGSPPLQVSIHPEDLIPTMHLLDGLNDHLSYNPTVSVAFKVEMMVS